MIVITVLLCAANAGWAVYYAMSGNSHRAAISTGGAVALFLIALMDIAQRFQ